MDGCLAFLRKEIGRSVGKEGWLEIPIKPNFAASIQSILAQGKDA